METYPSHEFTVSLGGADVTEYVSEWNVSGDRGGPVSGTIVLVHHDGEIVSDANPFADTAPGTALDIDVTVGSTSPPYPDFITGAVEVSEDGAVVTVNFSDKHPLVDLDNQSIDDVLADEGDEETAHSVLQSLASLVPVSISPAFTNYDIRTFRMNEENVLAKIDELAQVKQAYRKFVGSTLRLEALGDSEDPDWTIEDRTHIPEGGMTRSVDTSGLRTFFRCFRLAPQPVPLAPPYTCTGNDCVGRTVDVRFSRPSRRVQMIHTARNGEINAGVFVDENGDPLTSNPTDQYAGADLAYGWKATYEALPTDEEYTPSYRVITVGGGTNNEEEGFSAEKAVTKAESLLGYRVPEYRNLATELIADQATAAAMLDALATEVEWSVIKYSLSTPFVSSGLCGAFAVVTHHGLGLSSERLLIQSFNHGWSGSGGFDCSYELRGEL